MEHKTQRRQSGAVTIHDVARRAGVSAMTVSRVINAEKNVRPATRAAVNAAIRALHYAPNPAARSLASADLIRIGLLYGNPSAAFLSEFLVGTLDQCGRSNIQLVVEKCDGEAEEKEVLAKLIAAGMDGVILPAPLCDAAFALEALSAAETPAVAVATGLAAASIPAISIDDFAAAHEMTTHLIGLGHRRIGFITGDPGHSSSGQRLAGHRAALAEAGIADDPALVVTGHYTYRSGLEGSQRLLDAGRPPTAIFASNDDMAAAAVAVAHRRGLDVPGDLAVCGFDDTALATTIWPELTTIRQPITEMSRKAVDVLVDEIRSRRAGIPARHPRILLDYRLVRRQSDASPGARHENARRKDVATEG